MRNIKLFGLIVLGVFVFVGCNGVDDSDRITNSLNELDTPEMSDFEDGLDYYEARLDYFETIVEILTTEALEPDADAVVILSEIEVLLGLIETERDNYEQFTYVNFERHCYEDGGTVIEEYEAVWCDTDTDSLNQQRHSKIWDRIEELIPRTMAIEYVLFDSLEDFDETIGVLESEISEFETEIDARLAYAEDNETETWDLIYHGNLHWGYWEDLVTNLIDFNQRIEAIGIGIELNPHVTGSHRRLESLHYRLTSRIQNTFVTS